MSGRESTTDSEIEKEGEERDLTIEEAFLEGQIQEVELELAAQKSQRKRRMEEARTRVEEKRARLAKLWTRLRRTMGFIVEGKPCESNQPQEEIINDQGQLANQEAEPQAPTSALTENLIGSTRQSPAEEKSNRSSESENESPNPTVSPPEKQTDDRGKAPLGQTQSTVGEMAENPRQRATDGANSNKWRQRGRKGRFTKKQRTKSAKTCQSRARRNTPLDEAREIITRHGSSMRLNENRY